MEIKLSPEESEEYFYNALCNGAGYVQCHGISIDAESDIQYQEAKIKLKNEKPGTVICIEDVWMEVLRMGKKLKLTDEEGDDHRTIELKDVHDRVQKTPLYHLEAMIEEQDDADTADAILQTVFLEEIIYG